MKWQQLLENEVSAIDSLGTAKRHEVVIEGFTHEEEPRAIINGKKVHIFNSNDYMGLRHNAEVKRAECEASEKFGAGPGAVRFISGSLSIYSELEAALAKFHGRDEAMIFSSAFAANLAVLFCLIRGQRKDTLVNDKVLVISDELNHRSIIDGIRLANLGDDKKIFSHLNIDDLKRVLEENMNTYDRVIVVTDGVFSMLGEIQNIAQMRRVIDEYDSVYKNGVQLVVDDCHGVGAIGKHGKGTEEVMGAKADVLVGTMGKAFGADGGYVVADSAVIRYLREASATYIYSNPISPGTAGAALKALSIIERDGAQYIEVSQERIVQFQEGVVKAGFRFAAESKHPIQPLLIGDAHKARELTKQMLEKGYLMTQISYPVVPAGKDEIRVQISANHTRSTIDTCVEALTAVGRELHIV